MSSFRASHRNVFHDRRDSLKIRVASPARAESGSIGDTGTTRGQKFNGFRAADDGGGLDEVVLI